MNKSVAQQIRRLRQNNDLSQDNMADELGITKGAYSKIERGITAISVDRLAQIAGVFKVDIITFFRPATLSSEVAEQMPQYGFATKSELEELANMINALRSEIQNVKKQLEETRKPSGRKSKK